MQEDIVTLRSCNTRKLMKEIEGKLGKSTRRVHLCIRPTRGIIAAILSAAPNVEIITCPPSLYEKVPAKIRIALSRVGVKFEPATLSPGRPRQHPEWKIHRIREMRKRGARLTEICKAVRMPLSTVQYYLSRFRSR